MGRILVALRAFFGALLSGDVARRLDGALRGEAALPAPQPTVLESKPKPKPPRPARSEAVSFLAALQREARFIDFLMEPLDGFEDQQVGAAARDVHRGCKEAVQRMFALAPLLEQEEGQPIEVPSPLNPDRFRLVGNVSGEPPYQGTLAHHGWRASHVKLPTWNGAADAALVVAPAEVELE